MDTTQPNSKNKVTFNNEENSLRGLCNIRPTIAKRTAKPLFKLPTIAFTKHSGKYNVTRNSNTILKENVPSAIFKGIDPSTPINENNTTPLTQPRLGNADKNYSINVTSVPKLRSNVFDRLFPKLIPKRNSYDVAKKNLKTGNNEAPRSLVTFKKNIIFNDSTSISETNEKPSETEFKNSDEMSATQNGTVKQSIPKIPILPQRNGNVHSERKRATTDDGINKRTGDEFSRKRPLDVHNRFSSAKRPKNKHIYFDNDGNEIIECDKTINDTTELLHSYLDDDTMVELPHIISSHFQGKSSFRCPNKIEMKKWRTDKFLLASLPHEIAIDKGLDKYWHKRFALFSLYDFGIKMDRESWFSVTPEQIADRIAKRCKCDIIIDGFCGAGGNAIQFATTCKQVIAIDIDPKKIEMAKHNAKIYGVSHRIEFIVGDFLMLVNSFKANVIFLSPPWGGPEYFKEDVYDVETGLTPVSASELLIMCRKITQNIAMYLPRNSDTHQLAKLAGPERPVEIEKCSLDGKLTAITAYYGTLFNK